jgi:hypothetical protein
MCNHPEDPADAIIFTDSRHPYEDDRSKNLASGYKCGELGPATSNLPYGFVHKDCAVRNGLRW